jgi:TRAP-type transport system periplasmic protein
MAEITRRTLVAGSAALALASTGVAHAQAKPKMRFSSAFTETDLRTEAYKALAAAMKDDFDFEPYWGNTLFKQGTELVALQRENLELCNLAPADISKQIPAWSLMTSAYLFRDYDHLKKTFASDVGQEFIKMARDQLGIELIRPVFFGARQLNLRPNRKINTPADLAGIKLRMPPGEFWQFLGESLGANPTPVAYAELYTALQSGAVDGQDNPLVSGRSMKFYEVTSQFILTNHVLGANAAKYNAQEQDAIEFFKKEGKQVYAPDQNAFRAFAQKKYLDKYANEWPKGAIERINAIK